MWDWLNSPEFFLLAMMLAAAVVFCFRKRRLKKESQESWEALPSECTSTRKIEQAPEAAWITALRVSVARDAWKPGLKPSPRENVREPQLHPSYEEVTGQLENDARQAAQAESEEESQRYSLHYDSPEPAKRTAGTTADAGILWARCESGDPRIVELRRWLTKGKTVFTVIVFPPADHEWETIHEGQAVLEEVTKEKAKFRMDGANLWMFFPDFTLGYDRKRKRPLIQFRERF